MNPDELERIQKHGYDVIRRRIYKFDEKGMRQGGGLNLSRAIGDFFYEGSVPCTPDVKTHTLTAEDKFLILASDGLWDVLTNDRVCMLANQKKGEKEIAGYLVQTAYEENSQDNITAVVVNLQPRENKN
jgi:serine/threonine protein phosphatase PrpC